MKSITLRSPHEMLGGLVHFPRMLDKIRAHAAGQLPDAYHGLLGRGFDQRLCRFLQIDFDLFYTTTIQKAFSDEQALQWIQSRGDWPDPERCEIFNGFMRKRGWRDDLSPRIQEMAEEMGLDDDGSIKTAFACLDADEGRPLEVLQTDQVSPILADRIRLFQAHAQPFGPIPTNEKPLLPAFENIRAVVFDVYGTLFMSGTGDISLAEAEDRSEAMRATLVGAGVTAIPGTLPLADLFHEAIKRAQMESREGGAQFPEVEIREVWSDFLKTLEAQSIQVPPLDRNEIARLAIDYECRVNPVWPLPDLAPLLAAIKNRGLLMGIVSNAQFYTKVMFPAFLGASIGDLGFSLDCCIYSYQEREGKPSQRLYRKLRNQLSAHRILPAETLYIGNDMRNDVNPAASEGFKTVLYAGDARSLRWRKEDSPALPHRPDAIINKLWQILDLIA
jgi:putative hydrolase of the HAD superfamily